MKIKTAKKVHSYAIIHYHMKTILNESNISKPSKLVYFLILFLKKIDFIDKNVLKQINMNNLLEKTDVV